MSRYLKDDSTLAQEYVTRGNKICMGKSHLHFQTHPRTLHIANTRSLPTALLADGC